MAWCHRLWRRHQDGCELQRSRYFRFSILLKDPLFGMTITCNIRHCRKFVHLNNKREILGNIKEQSWYHFYSCKMVPGAKYLKSIFLVYYRGNMLVILSCFFFIVCLTIYTSHYTSYYILLKWIGLHSTLETRRIRDMSVTINSCFQGSAPASINRLINVRNVMF